MTYTQLLPYLIQNGTVTPIPFPFMPKTHKLWYEENAWCVYLANSKGHNTENCRKFKLTVQELIDQKLLSFTNIPNVGNNPFPEHGGPCFNVVERFTDESLIKDVSEVKALLAVVYAKLDKANSIKGVRDQCEVCLSALD